MKRIGCFLICAGIFAGMSLFAQSGRGDSPEWIRPADATDEPVWGMRNGLVFSLWPYGVENPGIGGGPRGLIRIGNEFRGQRYLINFIAVEPVANGKMEFSEISPSRVDDKWGKLMWAGSDSSNPGKYYPVSITRGVITHPDPDRPEIEELVVWVFMEKFLNGAHPYLKLSMRSDRPEELGLTIFHHEDSAPMARCALTATMGNYSRLRLIYLKNRIVDSRQYFEGFNDINFIDKPGFGVEEMLKTDEGAPIAIAAPNESFASLSSWPQEGMYQVRSFWRYRPFYKVTQYWRKGSEEYDASLHIRTNGRAKYWSGASDNPDDYMDIPGGVSFENFELREKYYSGQTFYFGVTRETPEQVAERFGVTLPSE